MSVVYLSTAPKIKCTLFIVFKEFIDFKMITKMNYYENSTTDYNKEKVIRKICYNIHCHDKLLEDK